MAPVGLLSAFFPPAPTFTDKDLPSLNGKVYIVTGSATGVGYETAKILYSAGATVYIGARSAERCREGIKKIEDSTSGVVSGQKGRLESMVVDLANLSTVKLAAQRFLATEVRLDGLIQNAAVMMPPAGSKDKYGRDLETSTNCLGPYLLALLLEPVLLNTASISPPYSVRIVWVTSMLQRSIPQNGMGFDDKGAPKILTNFMGNYMQTKVGVAWLADKFSRRLGKNGILSVSLHPGLMPTELQRDSPGPMRFLMHSVIPMKGPIYGAYSEIYAAFSPEVTAEHNGGYLMAWGRIAELPKEIEKELSPGGNSEKFYSYCDREIKPYM
ncbi:putative short-chain dehydrogenase [Halenospora varia]|nr:putative short-chain dehydrogenase [Halenospora varia]